MKEKNLIQEEVKLSSEEIAVYQYRAKQELLRSRELVRELIEESGANVHIDKIYPFVGSFSAIGLFAAEVSSIGPMIFDNNIKLNYWGKGGGIIIGGGAFAGAGVLFVDPNSLINKKVDFILAATGGALNITLLQNFVPVGNFTGVGPSYFAGAAGGEGKIKKAE